MYIEKYNNVNTFVTSRTKLAVYAVSLLNSTANIQAEDSISPGVWEMGSAACQKGYRTYLTEGRQIGPYKTFVQLSLYTK